MSRHFESRRSSAGPGKTSRSVTPGGRFGKRANRFVFVMSTRVTCISFDSRPDRSGRTFVGVRFRKRTFVRSSRTARAVRERRRFQETPSSPVSPRIQLKTCNLSKRTRTGRSFVNGTKYFQNALETRRTRFIS